MHGRGSKEYIFRFCNTSAFNATRFDEDPFACQCEKESKGLEGLKFRTFNGSFSGDIMAVTGLITVSLLLHRSWDFGPRRYLLRDNSALNEFNQTRLAVILVSGLFFKQD